MWDEIFYEFCKAEIKLNFEGQMIMKGNSRMASAKFRVKSFTNLLVNTKQGGIEI
jgi:hypothetical protein